MALSLTLTYQALVKARADSLRSRIRGLLGVLVQTGETNVRTRITLLHQLSRDTSLVHAATTPGVARTAAEDSASCGRRMVGASRTSAWMSAATRSPPCHPSCGRGAERT
jgi:hypothetical protein